MSNVDSTSTNDNPRSLKNIFLDLKSDLKTKSEHSFKLKKKFEECVGSSSEISGNSTSNFDEEISMFLKNTNQAGNLMDLLNKKYFIGYAISEAFSGTDLDAYTLFHLWNTKRTSQKSFVMSNHNFNTQEETLELTNRQESVYKDLFVIFYQQLFFSWQSELDLIDRTRPIFKIPPQNNSLVHAIEPKTTCLVLLTYIYGLNNIKFLGLKNDPRRTIVPGPYMSLLNNDSRGDFLTCLTKFIEMVFNKDSSDKENTDCVNQQFPNIEGYLGISYFVNELDLIYTYILFDDKCYSRYTEPILLKSFTSWTYGKFKLLLHYYRMKSRYRHLTMTEVLTRFDVVLSLICKIFTDHKTSSRQAPLDKFITKNFNFLCFTCVVYSYLYAILSIPLELLPWENFVFDKPLPSLETNDNSNSTTSSINNSNTTSNTHSSNSNEYENQSKNKETKKRDLKFKSKKNKKNDRKQNYYDSKDEFEVESANSNLSSDSDSDRVSDLNSPLDLDPDLNGPGSDEHDNQSDNDLNEDEKDYENQSKNDSESLDSDELNENYDIINMSVHNEFAETAADSTCIENTRRHDNLMTYVIGLVNGEGNWIKKKEKFVDVIDTYKLGLSWYRRPSFSNTLYNTSYKAWPIALYYYYLLIEPCGRAFFVWYWKNIEAWSCSNIWSYRIKFPSTKNSGFSQFVKRLKKKKCPHTDSNLLLKRQVSIRLRDTVSFLFDMEMELKRSLLYS